MNENIYIIMKHMGSFYISYILNTLYILLLIKITHFYWINQFSGLLHRGIDSASISGSWLEKLFLIFQLVYYIIKWALKRNIELFFMLIKVYYLGYNIS